MASTDFSPAHIIRLATLALLCALALLFAPGTGFADAEGEQAEAEAATAETREVPAERRSPRATMRTFLRGFAEADEAASEALRDRALERIVGTLDLSDTPAIDRRRVGQRLAYDLKTKVLDKHAFIRYEDIPDDPDAEPYLVLQTAAGVVEIVPDTHGDWRFSRATVDSIDRLAAYFADRQTVEGVVTTDTLKPVSDLLRERLPRWMTRDGFMSLLWYQWIGIALLIMLALVFGRIISHIIIGFLESRVRKTRLGWDGSQSNRLVIPMTYIVAVLLWWTLEGLLALPPQAVKFSHQVAVIFFGVASLVFLFRAVDLVSDRMAKWAEGTESKFDDLLVPFVRKSAKVVALLIGVLAILENLQIDLTGALATLGIGGLAFALAAKDTVSNLFGSVTVIADRPFQIGDWIVVDGFEGMVESLGFRSTRIRTFYNSLIVMPNSNLINATVDNYGARQYRRYTTAISVTYNTPPERLEAFCEGIRQLIEEYPYTRKDYYHVYFHTYNSSSLDILVYMFFETPDWSTELRERHRLNMDILRLAKKLGVEFAFPTQTLYMERGTGPAEPSDEALSPKEAIEQQMENARRASAEIVRTTLGPPGTRPAPVVFRRPSQAPIQPGEEGM